jgi:hypothetical protein
MDFDSEKLEISTAQCPTMFTVFKSTSNYFQIAKVFCNPAPKQLPGVVYDGRTTMT